MSWEAHLFGGLAGLLVAFVYRGEGPQRKVYVWEEELDEIDEEIASAEETTLLSEPTVEQGSAADTNHINIHYIYTPKNNTSTSPDDEKN